MSGELDGLQSTRFLADSARCVRCSICTPVCPSYAVYGNESDSPRGRVQLMRAAVQGRVPVDQVFQEHLDRCLECRACEDVCPSAVPYARLLDRVREQLVPHRTGLKAALFGFFLGELIHRPWALRLMALGARALQRLGLDRLLARWVRKVSEANALRLTHLPAPEPGPFELRGGDDNPTIQFFAGCVMSAFLGETQRATVRVLRAHGQRVGLLAAQVCCGSLHLHAGRREEAKALARRNIEAFEASAPQPIAVNSAGCGLAMKEYGLLLADDPNFAERAKAFSARVKDVAELLKAAPANPGCAGVKGKVAVHEPCHQWNIQRLRGTSLELLKRAGVDAVALPRGAGCCGSAGLFSLMEPEAGQKLLEETLKAVDQSGCGVIVTSNPGCMLYLQSGLRAKESGVRVVHLASALDDEGKPSDG